jgi:hypothetical protein
VIYLISEVGKCRSRCPVPEATRLHDAMAPTLAVVRRVTRDTPRDARVATNN